MSEPNAGDIVLLTSAWTAARLRLGKIGGIAALAAPLAAAAIGYHGVTKRR